MKYFLILSLTAFLLAGCAASQKTKNESTPPSDDQTGTKYDESFDPLSLDDDELVITKDPARESDTTPRPEVEKPQADDAQETVPVNIREEDGYRVQLLATRNIETATLSQEQAREQFEPLHHKVYLIFEAPFWKIRIGDFKARSEAERVRDTVKDMGYNQAFPVRSKINVYPAGVDTESSLNYP